VTDGAGDARRDWEARIGRRSDREELGHPAALSPPSGLTADPGAGQVTLRWSPVPGALGYLVYRAAQEDGDYEPVDHHGRDVLAVPGCVYTDTTGQPGTPAWYAIATIADAEQSPGRRSDPVGATPRVDDPGPVRLSADLATPGQRLRRVWHMIGSERLSQLLIDEQTGGRPIASEFDEALQLAVAELGVERIRAHAIFHDDLGVYREHDGRAVHDFRLVDEVYDRVLELGLKPVVELAYMPRDLARDPDATVFEYGAIISPPNDWRRWAELCGALAAHLVDRYGIEEVRTWGFEVWNEANLEVFWTGSRDDYLRLYEEAARAVKAVDARLLVGGPASAAAGWLGPFLDGVEERGMSLDFVSTHTYGNVPLNVRSMLDGRGQPDVAVWWTEWGITPTHFYEVTDGPFGAPFVLHGMKAAQTSADWLAYWVVSDHFEELGRPPALLHGGFGLLTVGNLRKPRWWALALAEQLGDELVDTRLEGDGAGGMVDAWVGRHDDGRVEVLAWNGTLDQSKRTGSDLLARRLEVALHNLPAGRYSAQLTRIDESHGNLAVHWDRGRDWPDVEEWSMLAEQDRLEDQPLPDLTVGDGRAELAFDLPMPGVARLRLTPLD
jgi:xylan 1,4-beta-xylosidase